MVLVRVCVSSFLIMVHGEKRCVWDSNAGVSSDRLGVRLA